MHIKNNSALKMVHQKKNTSKIASNVTYIYSFPVEVCFQVVVQQEGSPVVWYLHCSALIFKFTLVHSRKIFTK